MHSSMSCIRWRLLLSHRQFRRIRQSAAAGQQDLTASIIGQVTDQSGAVLPGVTVTATGPALQCRW